MFPKLPANLQCLYKISRKEVRDGNGFLHVDKHESFLQVDLNTFGIKVSCQVIHWLEWLSILSSQGNKFAISLKYLKKEDEVYFLHADKHESL